MAKKEKYPPEVLLVLTWDQVEQIASAVDAWISCKTGEIRQHKDRCRCPDVTERELRQETSDRLAQQLSGLLDLRDRVLLATTSPRQRL